MRKITFSTVFSTIVLMGVPIYGSAQEIWSEPSRIVNMYSWHDGTLDFRLEWSNPLSTCDGGTRWRLPITNPGQKTQVAALMLAFSMGKEIKIYIPSDTPSACAPNVNRFFVY